MSKPRHDGVRARRAFTAAVLLLVAILLAVFVVPQARTERRTAQLQTATTAAYQQTRPAVDQRRRTADQVLARTLRPATLNSAAVSCQLEEDHAGLMVQNWRQVCTIRTLDVYPTTLSYPALAAQLESAATGVEELLGAASSVTRRTARALSWSSIFFGMVAHPPGLKQEPDQTKPGALQRADDPAAAAA